MVALFFFVKTRKEKKYQQHNQYSFRIDQYQFNWKEKQSDLEGTHKHKVAGWSHDLKNKLSMRIFFSEEDMKYVLAIPNIGKQLFLMVFWKTVLSILYCHNCICLHFGSNHVYLQFFDPDALNIKFCCLWLWLLKVDEI